MTKNDNLKPCPFCGVKPTLITYKDGSYFICSNGRYGNCPMYCGTTRTYKTKKLLIKAWNTRPET